MSRLTLKLQWSRQCGNDIWIDSYIKGREKCRDRSTHICGQLICNKNKETRKRYSFQSTVLEYLEAQFRAPCSFPRVQLWKRILAATPREWNSALLSTVRSANLSDAPCSPDTICSVDTSGICPSSSAVKLYMFAFSNTLWGDTLRPCKQLNFCHTFSNYF